MAKQKVPHLTAPVPSKDMPRGIPYIVGNEAAERFSYYGMKAILIVFMTQHLMGADGVADPMMEAEARYWYHMFGTAVYFFPILGAIIADAFFGKYKTIVSLSIVYCLGHLALALDETRVGLSIGLTLIAIGSGGIKPCVSAHVGDQFGKTNKHLIEKVFLWFYFSINLGAMLSTILTPILLKNYGPSVAFGVPGALMLLATWVFWMGRGVFVHIPAGGTNFIKEVFSAEGIRALGKLFVIYLFVAMFWALFDQTGSSWVLQAKNMDLNILGYTLLPSQIQAVNPLLVMIFIFLFGRYLFPFINQFYKLTSLRKITIGLFLTVPSFLLIAYAEHKIQQGLRPSIIWQVWAYIIITAAEIFVSITALEFSYTQAPKQMKSFVMAFFLFSVSLGNQFAAQVNNFIQEKVVVSKNAVSGTVTVTPKKTTAYSVVCKSPEKQDWRCGYPLLKNTVKCVDKSFTTKKLASVNINIFKKKKGPKVTSFTADGQSGSIVAYKKEEILFSWSSTRTSFCQFGLEIEKLPAKGSRKVKIFETEDITLNCFDENGAKGSKTISVKVTKKGPKVLSWLAGIAPKEAPKAKKAQPTSRKAFKKTAKKEAPFDGHTVLSVRKGTKVALAWKSKNAMSCRISPREVNLKPSGKVVIVANKTEIYTLTCFDDEHNKIRSKVKVRVDEGVKITQFGMTKKGSKKATSSLSFYKKAEPITLSWSSERAKYCKVYAETNKLEGPSYYLFFAGTMFLAAFGFIFVAFFYTEKTYIQDEAEEDDDDDDV